jgi:hypothetical protein
VSEDLTVLKEYLEGLNLKPTKMAEEDLVLLKNELKDAGEFGLARLIEGLSGPEELLEYVGEEE